mmetsp:Transcript_159526/g.511873  ORF Transcript_159526/g.511873 Transcript_159526/m.511873 type:complete len:308 (+) Transcript_159526:105-1028(+)
MLGTCIASVTFEVEDQWHAFALPEGCVPGSITVEKLKSLIGERAQKEVLYHEKLRVIEPESRRPLEADEVVPLTPKVVKVAGPKSVATMLRMWLAKRGQPKPKEPGPPPTPKLVAPRAGAAAAQQTGLTSRGYRPAAALPNGAGGGGVLQSGGQPLPSAYSGGYRGASGGVGHFGDVGSGFGRGGYGAAGSGVGSGMPTSLPDASHVALEQRQRQQEEEAGEEERQLEIALRASQMSIAADEEAQLKWALEESRAFAESDDDELPPLEPLDRTEQQSGPEVLPDSEESCSWRSRSCDLVAKLADVGS